MDLLFDVTTGFGLAAIAGVLVYAYTALSRDPRERRRGRHVAPNAYRRAATAVEELVGRRARHG